MHNKVHNSPSLLAYHRRISDRSNVGHSEKKNPQNIFNHESIDDNIWFLLLQADNYFSDNRTSSINNILQLKFLVSTLVWLM